MKALLKLNYSKLMINELDEEGNTPLMLACRMKGKRTVSCSDSCQETTGTRIVTGTGSDTYFRLSGSDRKFRSFPDSCAIPKATR